MSLTHGLLHKAPYNIAAGFPRREQERVPKMEATAFVLLNRIVTSHHHLCHILFVRSKPLNPAHTQGKMIIQDHENEETRFWGAILVLPITPSLPFNSV